MLIVCSAPLSAELEILYLRGYFVFALVSYFRWAHLVVNAICGYLGIHCLRIKPKATPPGVLNGHIAPGLTKQRAC